MYVCLSVCLSVCVRVCVYIDVFCDADDGILTARSLSDGDDVSVMTSSVSNLRGAGSAFESSAQQLQLHGVQLHGVQLEGVQEERREGMRRVRDLAACVEMLNRPQTFTSDTVTMATDQQQQQQGGQVGQVHVPVQPRALQVERKVGVELQIEHGDQVQPRALQVERQVGLQLQIEHGDQVQPRALQVERQVGVELQIEHGDQVTSEMSERFNRKLVNIQRPTTTMETIAAETPSSTQSLLPTVAPVTSRWNRVPPPQPGTALERAREPAAQLPATPGSRVPADKRATPPVSRVKPMIRPTVATGTNQRSDISSSTSAHAPSASKRKQVPVCLLYTSPSPRD